MSRITLNIPDAIRGRLSKASTKTGFSETDLAKALLSAGLDQIEGDGVVIRAPHAAACRRRKTLTPHASL